MKGETFSVIVVAILAVALITVAIIFLTTIAKHASYYLARQACKVSAFLKYVADVKARVAEKLLPIPIFVTSHECNINVQLDEGWIAMLARKLKKRSEEEEKEYGEILGNFSIVLEGCGKVLEKGDDEELKKYCLKLLSYFTLAYLIKDTWDTFSDLNEDISVFCISFPKEILPFTIDENSINIAINLLYSKEELAAKEDYCPDPFENKMEDSVDTKNSDSIIKLLSHICSRCVKSGKDICIVDNTKIGTAACNITEKWGSLDLLNNLRKVTVKTSDGGFDKIVFPDDGIVKISSRGSRICIKWTQRKDIFRSRCKGFEDIERAIRLPARAIYIELKR